MNQVKDDSNRIRTKKEDNRIAELLRNLDIALADEKDAERRVISTVQQLADLGIDAGLVRPIWRE